jgi:hypothetical protein
LFILKNKGGAEITEYVVTSNIGGITVSKLESQIVITGLAAGKIIML